MVLPSQSGRPVSRHSHMYRRKRGRRPLITVLVVLAVVAVVGWVWWSNHDPSPAAAVTERGEQTDSSSTTGTSVKSSNAEKGSSRQGRARSPLPREQRVAMGEPVNSALLGKSTATSAREPQRDASPTVSPPARPRSDDSSRQQTTNESETTAGSATATESSSTAPSAVPPTPPNDPAESDPPGTIQSPEEKSASAPSTGADGTGDQSRKDASPVFSPGVGGASGDAGAPTADDALRAVPLEEQDRARQLLQTGLNLQAENKPVEARRVLTQAHETRALNAADDLLTRQTLAQVNDLLVFGPTIVSGDPLASAYVVQPGDTLQQIAKPCRVEWEFIARINRMSNPRSLQINQKIKIISGPFHAIVDKGDYRLDLYAGDGAQRLFIRSFPVGLGEYNSTPLGRFKVRPRSKLQDPAWTNPRTHEYFEPSNPLNPIGEFWIGLEGLDQHTQEMTGYGIHGTIELDSIGQQRSMGCVRMLPDDIAIIYELLMPEISTVEVSE